MSFSYLGTFTTYNPALVSDRKDQERWISATDGSDHRQSTHSPAKVTEILDGAIGNGASTLRALVSEAAYKWIVDWLT